MNTGGTKWLWRFNATFIIILYNSIELDTAICCFTLDGSIVKRVFKKCWSTITLISQHRVIYVCLKKTYHMFLQRNNQRILVYMEFYFI